MDRNPTLDQDWQDLADEFDIRSDTCYLNHGSFGISPRSVLQSRFDWIRRLEQQPMDFYLRQLEPAFHETRNALGRFVAADPQDLIFVENSTYGMNVVAQSFPLQSGDEILLTSQEYGAVKRTWDLHCEKKGAQTVTADLKLPFENDESIIESLFEKASPRTRLIVVSHITSETGTILPVQKIRDEAARRSIAVCIDGPHALAQTDVSLEDLGCDFYTASCHKWLTAPLGSGFLYVSPKWQPHIYPLVQSWGRLNPNTPENWDEEFIWKGTRDPSAYFSIAEAIRFMESVGIEGFQKRSQWLADQMLSRLIELFGTKPIYPLGESAARRWYGSMCELPLPDRMPRDQQEQLQLKLWTKHGIEVPIFEFENQKMIRVSFHLYNDTQQIEKLCQALINECCVG